MAQPLGNPVAGLGRDDAGWWVYDVSVEFDRRVGPYETLEEALAGVPEALAAFVNDTKN